MSLVHSVTCCGKLLLLLLLYYYFIINYYYYLQVALLCKICKSLKEGFRVYYSLNILENHPQFSALKNSIFILIIIYIFSENTCTV